MAEDTVSLMAAAVNKSTSSLTAGVLSRCKSDQNAAADIFEREEKKIQSIIQSRPDGDLINSQLMSNGGSASAAVAAARRMSLEQKATTDKV